MHLLNIRVDGGVCTYPAHKHCANFRNGICILHGVPVNPDGPACQRFMARSVEPLLTHRSTNPALIKGERLETDLSELKRRLDAIELKIQKIKAMLKH